MYEGFPDYVLAGNGKSIPFNSGTADTIGNVWTLDGAVEGWDSPDGRVTMLTKIGSGPDADGEYPADQHYRGRTLTFTLYASCSSEIDRQNAKYLLAQVLDLIDSQGTLTVNEDVPKFVDISRSGNSNQGKLKMTDMGLSAVAPSTPGFPTAEVNEDTALLYLLKAEIEVYSADPRKYSVTPITQSWGTVTSEALANPGNTDTQRAVLTMAPGGPFTMTFPVGGLNILVPTVPAGAPSLSGIPDPLIIDLYNKTLQDNSGDNFYYLRNLGFAPWPAIPSGDSTFDPGSVPGSLTYYPAWL